MRYCYLENVRSLYHKLEAMKTLFGEALINQSRFYPYTSIRNRNIALGCAHPNKDVDCSFNITFLALS